MPKKTPRPRPLSGAGRGQGPGARVFRGPVRPVTNSNDKLVEQREYQSLVGSLMYIAVGTRPDLAFTVSVSNKFNSKPTMDHFLATKRVLRYLKETVGMGLVYGSVDNLIGYTDSDLAGDLNDRK